MKKLIINADDFGYRESINKGIFFAHKNGLVSSASLFTDMEATEAAVVFAKENPGLGIGIHLNLDKFFVVDHQLGIVTDWMQPKASSQDIESEARRQIEKFKSFGLSADHINSHHHAHMHPEVFPIISKLAAEFSIPVIRLFSKFFPEQNVYNSLLQNAKDNSRLVVDHFIEGWYWGNIDEEYQIAELMTHPGYGELWREAELAHCCQPHLKNYFMEQKIELIRFIDLVNK